MLSKIVQKIVPLAIICALIYLQLAGFHSWLFGWLVFALYLSATSGGAFVLLHKFYQFSRRALRVKVLAIFLVLITLALWASLALNIFPFTALTIALVFFLNGLVWAVVDVWVGEADDLAPELDNPDLAVVEEVPQSKIGLLAIVILVIYGFYLLFSDRSGAIVTTPWAVIDPFYVIVFGLAAAILGFLIFSEIKAKTIIFFIIVLSLLQHAYLPATHELFYGADGWRHLATENQIIQNSSLQLTSYAQNPGSLLEQINPGRFSYGSLWGLTIILNQILRINLITLNAWLVPILWSLILPILLFEFGRFLGWSKKEALLLAWLSLLPFAWQAGGAFSLPVGLGFPFWLLLLLMLLKSSQAENKQPLYVIYALGIFSAFGYLLYFILFWLIAAVQYLWQKINARLATGLTLAGSIILFPLIELSSGYSHFGSVNIFDAVKQFLGNFSAYYLASGPRPHDIATGNILFNQTPLQSFVPNLLTAWPWLLVIFALIFWIAVIRGIWLKYKQPDTAPKIFALLTVGLWGGYFISRYLLQGEAVLSRRLDAVLAFFFVITAATAIIDIIRRQKNHQLSWYLAIVLVVSAALAAGYTLGPDTYAVSRDEYEAVNYVVQNMKPDNPCILGDTYQLLVAEALTAKKVVGGGWPINEYFAQPQREKFYADLSNQASAENWQQALVVRGTDSCWFVGTTDKVVSNAFIRSQGENIKLFGQAIVWYYKP